MRFLVATFGLRSCRSVDHARHALLPEGHEHASANHGFHPIWNTVGEDDIQRHRKRYVAEFRHGGASSSLALWHRNKHSPTGRTTGR